MEDSSLASINTEILNIGQISMTEIGIPERRFCQNSSSQVRMAEISTLKEGLEKNSITQVSIAKICSLQTSFDNVSPSQVGIAQVSTTQLGIIQNSTTKVSLPENSTAEVCINQTSFWQLHSSEIPLPSSVSSEQLFSIHNYSSPLTNTLKDNSLNFWQLLFDPTFKINFQIADLPTGQLAEAQIRPQEMRVSASLPICQFQVFLVHKD